MSIQELPVLLQKTKEIVTEDLPVTLAEFNLTEQRWRVICALAECKTSNAQDLASRCAILGPSLSRIINDLRRDGIIKTCVSHADQRELAIRLTAKGNRIHKKVEPIVSKHFELLIKSVGSAKLNKLKRILSELVAAWGIGK